MSKISLAVKYRPKSFDDVTEQESTKIILTQQLESGEIQHAYLFVGGAGTGKTTCARIFANEINHHEGSPIELDAASNSGVDDVRDIIRQAKLKSLDSEYKVFIIDECFPANTSVRTVDGDRPISKICVGDIVKGMSGNNRVTHIFKNSVLTDRLCCVTLNDRKIITTVEHLFFTNHGWVEASQLQKGDIVYGDESLQELWQRVCKTTGQRREILLSQMLNRVCEENPHTENKNSTMSDLWQTDDCSKLLEEENLFSRVQEQTYYEVQYTTSEYRIWDGVTETIIRKNEEIKSDAEQESHSEDANDKREEWNTSSMAYTAGWQREVHNSTDTLVASIRSWLGIGVSNKHKKSELARTSTTLVLQSRPWLFRKEAGSRGRWSRSQLEKWTIKGCEKNRSTTNAWVESVEIYKRGYNDELFRSSFTDTELSSGYVTMYDLEVENDHSYFVENVLVHNCHALSNTAWQAFLKLLEEPPAKSIFIFCTTDPQRIPKTIISRVQRYEFKRISQKGIVQRLDYILAKEVEEGNIPTGDHQDLDAVEYLAKIADGGMRDAITLMDKCLAYSSDLTVANIIKVLGTVDYKIMEILTNSFISHDRQKCIEIVEKIHMNGKDLKRFIRDYVNFILDVCKYDITRSFDYINIPQTEEEWLNEIEDSWFESVHAMLSPLVKLVDRIKYDSNPKSMVEVSFLLMMEEII